MFRNDLHKLSMTLVFLVATAFVSVRAVAADPWYPANASDVAAASGWFDTHPSWLLSGDAAMLQPTLDSARLASLNGKPSIDLAMPLQPTLDSARLDSLNGKPSVDLAMPLQPTLDPARLASLNGGQSAGMATLDNSKNQWIGPETVSAALSQLDDSNGHWIGPETVSAVLGQLQP